MLKKRELKILTVVDSPHTISDLADRLGWTRSSTSELIAELAERGLVETHRQGRQKVVDPARIEAVNRYRDLVQRYPHIDFSELLHGKAVEVLYHLDEPHTVREMADRTGNYRNTVHRVVKRFQERGLVRKTAGTYVLNDDFSELSSFARALVSHEHNRRIPASTATIIWESVDEFLLVADEDIDDEAFLLTGPRRFTEYGIPLLVTDRRHYFCSERLDEMSAADLVCHMLLIDHGARYRAYSALLVEKEPVVRETLRERAAHYGVADGVDELIDYLDSRGAVAGESHLAWTEFEQLADEYGVSL